MKNVIIVIGSSCSHAVLQNLPQLLRPLLSKRPRLGHDLLARLPSHPSKTFISYQASSTLLIQSDGQRGRQQRGFKGGRIGEEVRAAR